MWRSSQKNIQIRQGFCTQKQTKCCKNLPWLFYGVGLRSFQYKNVLKSKKNSKSSEICSSKMFKTFDPGEWWVIFWARTHCDENRCLIPSTLPCQMQDGGRKRKFRGQFVVQIYKFLYYHFDRYNYRFGFWLLVKSQASKLSWLAILYIFWGVEN